MRHLWACVSLLAVSHLSLGAVVIANNGFENPATASFLYNPSVAQQGGTGWTFVGNSGVARDGSFLPGGVQNAPDGVQAGILQQTGSFSQSLAGLAGGSYSFSFYAEGRNEGIGSNPFQVEIDGTPLTFGALGSTITPPVLSTFTFYQSDPVSLAAGDHLLSFVGTTAQSTGDATSFIDLVSATEVPEPVSVSVIAVSMIGLIFARRGAENKNGVDYVA